MQIWTLDFALGVGRLMKLKAEDEMTKGEGQTKAKFEAHFTNNFY
jgi:hypothetical protein